MARITDKSKLIAVKKSLIEIIIKDGSANASISKVAKKANVSVGYLYRHYQSKEDLILELFVDQFNCLSRILMAEITNNNSLKDVVKGFYSEIVERTNDDQNSILFLLKMMTDYSIKINEDMRTRLSDLIDLVREKFNSEISSNVEAEQIYMQVLGNILLFINLRKRGVLKESKITSKDLQVLTEVTINALK